MADEKSKTVEFELGCGALIAVAVVCLTILIIVGKVTVHG